MSTASAAQTEALAAASEDVNPLLADAPTVAVAGREVLLDGQRIDDLHAFPGDGTLHKLDGVFAALRARRVAWKASHPAQPYPGVVLFRFAAALPVAVAKSIFQTAAFAAHPNGSFLVRIAGSTDIGGIDADAFVPMPPDYKGPPLPAYRQLHVEMAADRFVLTWRLGDVAEASSTTVRREVVTRDAGGETVRYPDLATAIDETWRALGAHRSVTDRKLDQLSLHVDNRATFRRRSARSGPRELGYRVCVLLSTDGPRARPK